jgi:hypothetical protein
MVCSLTLYKALNSATGGYERSLRPEYDASTTQIIRGEFHSHFIARQDTDVMHPHLAGDVPEDHMPVFQLHTKRCIWEVLLNLTLHLDDVVFRHTRASVQLELFDTLVQPT